MGSAIMATASFIALSCLQPVAISGQSLDASEHAPISSGIYAAVSGERFRVTTTGPDPLTIVSEKTGQCLKFRRIDNKITQDILLYRGQECKYENSSHLDWIATLSNKVSGKIIFTNQKSFENKGFSPVELSLIVNP